jgi:2-polyprenyl-3-methyl-5-hydroxy-6-metoxy-1,4-benzoquinol methylase
MANADYAYVGTELDVFKIARNWKRYWSSVLEPYVGGRVLELGAGVGANAPFLLNARVTELVSLEPDAGFAEALQAAVLPLRASHRANIQIRQGMMRDLPAEERFDTIVYLDVLEHIERDRDEVAAAADRLRPGGHLLVLAPAFQQLYSEFDHAIGHYRRYTAATLKALTPHHLRVVEVRYLDALGAGLSAANRLILAKAMPSVGNILFWDRCIVPVSRIADRVLGRFVGRSVVCVWQKQG